MTTTAIDVQGDVQGACDDRLSAVRDAFAANFDDFAEVGASVAVTIDGETVVDLWAGHADRARTRPWQRDTIVNVWSSTKGLATLCAHMLVDRGQLDVDAPVTRYWPQFGQAGKESMPVRFLLTHQAGLNRIDAPLPPELAFDWDAQIHALEQQQPRWIPGTRHGYHTGTFGYLVGELIRRVDGRTVGTFLREEVTEPLGIDFFIGFGPEEDHRVADIIAAERPPSDGDPVRLPDSNRTNSREWRAAEMPSGNGHGNARALATVYGALARGGEIDGVRLLSAQQVERSARLVASGHDETLGVPTHRTLGFMRRFAEFDDVRPASTYGHSGAGGSQGFADPDRKLGFGYVMNQMLSPDPDEKRPPTGGMDPRGQRLVAALYDALT
ncbi:MAG: serine hydrolase domain-containing protein [Dehalococcoidia bacterium]